MISRVTFLVKILLLLTLSLAPWGTLLYSQTYRGTIKGDVRDSASQLVAGASVTAKNNATGESRETTTAADGTFIMPELAPGEYEVTGSSKGFASVKKTALVEVGTETNVNLAFVKVAEATQSINVTAEAPLIDTGHDTLGQVVDNRLVTELPLNGRDFGKLVALTPGVTVEGSGVAGTEKGFGQFNINGNRDRSNNYTLDGTDNNDPFFNNSALNQVGITGAPASLLPIDSIQEFNLQSQFGAEYGRNSGSVVNIVTKSGTNQFHGSLFEFFRNDALDARNFFNPTPDPKTAFRNNQFGGSLGGPILKDKTFFFFAYEGQRERVGSDFLLFVPTSTQIGNAETIATGILGQPVRQALVNILNFFPPATGFNGTSGTAAAAVRDKNDLNSFIIKGDHRLSAKESLSVRYAYGSSQQTFPLGSVGGFGSGSRLPQFAQDSPTRVQVVSASLLSVLNGNQLNEVRFGYSRFHTSFNSLDSSFDPASIGLNNLGTGKLGLPEFDFAGLLDNLGATAFSIPRGRVSQTYQILDNFTWINGRNTWKFGGEYRHAIVDSFNDNLERGLFTFSTSGLSSDPVTDLLASYFLGGNGSEFVLTNTGDTQRTTYNNELGFFGQDDFRARPDLTLNLGLRWEYFGPISEGHNLLSNLNPTTGLLQLVGTPGLHSAYNRDLKDFGPRLGFAWSPWNDFVVRGGYGIYYDYVPQNLLIANFTTSAGLVTNPIGPKAVLPMNFSEGAFAGTSTAPIFTIGSAPFSVFITPRTMLTPLVHNWNFNIQKKFGDVFSLETGYVGSKGSHLTRLFDANQTDANGNFPNPKFLEEDVFSDSAASVYHALQITGRIASWHRVSGFTTWTYSKSIDNASDGINFNFASAAFPQDSTNLRAERGPSTFDTRHRFTTALNYEIPLWSALPKRLAEGWQLNAIATAQTGRPIPIVTSSNTSGRFCGSCFQRPNLVSGVDPVLPNWNPFTGYLNPLAFQQPADGTFGDLGRDSIYGPAFGDFDFSVSKYTQIYENVRVQFRAEFFNILNHPNFALPNGTIVPGVNADGTLNLASNSNAPSPIGLITQTPDVAQGNPGLGGGGPRVIQLSLRVTF